MPSLAQRWIAVGAFFGALAVGFGAYGAHGLAEFLEKLGYTGSDLTRRVDIYKTAVHYQIVHALALVMVGLALDRYSNGWWRAAAWAFLVGILLFSGLLKVLAFAGPGWNWLGAIVPLGGLSMILGWTAIAIGAVKMPRRSKLSTKE